MDIPLAVLADSANISQEGKLNIFGIFNRLWSVSFPAQHAMMHLVIVFDADVGEAGQKKTMEVQLKDADGTKILVIQGGLLLPEQVNPGRRIRINHILPIAGLPLPKPGDYEFSILVNGETKAHAPFTVDKVQLPQAPVKP